MKRFIVLSQSGNHYVHDTHRSTFCGNFRYKGGADALAEQLNKHGKEQEKKESRTLKQRLRSFIGR